MLRSAGLPRWVIEDFLADANWRCQYCPRLFREFDAMESHENEQHVRPTRAATQISRTYRRFAAAKRKQQARTKAASKIAQWWKSEPHYDHIELPVKKLAK